MDYMELREQVNQIPIREVINSRISSVGFNRYLCPFHNDHTPNNFHIKDDWNKFKCFCCGISGGPIKFVSELEHISEEQATVNLAKQFGIISGKISFKPVKPVKQQIQRKVNVDKLHKIYSIFSNISVLMGNPKLSETHLNELLNNRHLTIEEIENTGYFSFPNLRVLRAFKRELGKIGYEEDDLKNVPGFYFDLNTKSWTFVNLKNNSGIGIPIRNSEGKIVGIQIRLDKPDDKGKYKWFSSAYATSGTTLYGSSPGSPVSVYYPDENKYNMVFITEGHFKGYQIAKHFNSIAYSVQGVSNWKSIPKMLPEVNYVYTCFDADFIYKESVLVQMIKMIEAIIGYKPSIEAEKGREALLRLSNKTKKDLRQNHSEDILKYKSELLNYYSSAELIVKVAYWDGKYGKGIDDVIFSQNKDKLESIEFQNIFDTIVKYLVSLDILRKRRNERQNIAMKNISFTENEKVKLFTYIKNR